MEEFESLKKIIDDINNQLKYIISIISRKTEIVSYETIRKAIMEEGLHTGPINFDYYKDK